MSEFMLKALYKAFLDTLTMVSLSAVIVWFAGIALGMVLVTTARGAIFSAPTLNRVLGAIINGFRATPFIILLVALIPLTRLLVGTTIGVWAAVVPITLSATPFFARVAEVSLREVNPGVIEAAQALGCERRHILFRVLLPEALPGIIGGFTLTLVAMIGASAMAGAIGAGGLGDLAIRYGYQRYDTAVMFSVIAILVVLVCAIQALGDRWVGRLKAR
ncbi:MULTISPECIES: methionine ABC transporter permease [unclassified Pseudomonas]|uniref:methionine ABC transporter permease n=1 Tax=unclassified Pseudomonas TaxID=196821 RepID=UPI000BCBF75D|nr:MULTISPECIES: methionine ABC transporter permease [unclassified Pseudomonas]PVZ20651.1 D-methionine transport system permease protein [Pseudomonas sp. URIL14HWK12:I12]PVZ27717.1 D-methionine transport system permease protein [Pseudomonas sp. URIL14HWK12:I10]PVZ38606.1 D-methionine transport system permease protein [Pseudomonas sp. URIL14HWK12:I11]SNZ02688.1 D-methionine transport system permease protein [Pseudomonas sp. URIL14HWK12:I9]